MYTEVSTRRSSHIPGRQQLIKKKTDYEQREKTKNNVSLRKVGSVGKIKLLWTVELEGRRREIIQE